MSTHAQTAPASGTSLPPITDLSSLEVNIDAKDNESNQAAQTSAKSAGLSVAYKKGLTDISTNVEQCRKDGKALADRWQKLLAEVANRKAVVQAALRGAGSALQSAIEADEKKTTDAFAALVLKAKENQGPTERALAKAHSKNVMALALYTAFQLKSLGDRATTVESLLKEAIAKDDTTTDAARQYALVFLAEDWTKTIRTTDGQSVSLDPNPTAVLAKVKDYEQLLVKYFLASADADAAETQANLAWVQTKAQLTKQTSDFLARVSKRKDNLLAAAARTDQSIPGTPCPPPYSA